MPASRNNNPRTNALRDRLDPLLTQFSDNKYVENDPLGEVKKFNSPADREVAAFIAAGFAFGNIKSIISHLREIRRRTGPEIAGFAKRHFYSADAAPFAGLKYRWITPRATCVLFHVLGEILRKHGSLEKFFSAVKSSNLAETLQSFSQRALSLAPEKYKKPDLRGLSYFFSAPSGGACKRLNLFLRWVVRKNAPDLGLWSCLAPRELVIPLDVHVARAAAGLGLTSRKTRDWKMAAEITGALRLISPDDPLKYDFALHKLGATARSPY